MATSITQTISGGIQEIAAILPLLGTGKCEMHTGSALSTGFCYVSITPISIFGSLGIATAGFNVLVASIVIPYYRFLGAKILADGGFAPTGSMAPMIALDPKNRQRFLAESRLEKLLQDEHIKDAVDLSVEWAEHSLRWNLFMIALTFLAALVGLTPYIYIIEKLLKHSDRNRDGLFLQGWPLPVFRVTGSFLSAVVIQIIIQTRVLIIIKTRLVFIAVDRLTVDNKPLASRMPDWNAGNSSEMCIWALKRKLRELQNARVNADESQHSNTDQLGIDTNCLRTRPSEEAGTRQCSRTDSKSDILTNTTATHRSIELPEATGGTPTFNAEEVKNLQESLETAMDKHFPSSSLMRGTFAETFIIYSLLPAILSVGLILSIGGYLGSFYLLQNVPKEDVTAPLLWLSLEVVLCLLRILVWALNPKWDRLNGILFKLKLVPNCPLITCDIYGDEIEAAKTAPVFRADGFLDEITLFTGRLKPFEWPDVALYYILTGKSSKFEDKSKILYLIILDYKEQTSRLLLKRNPTDKNFEIHVSNLVFDKDSKHVTVNFYPSETHERHDPNGEQTHILTSNPEFMEKILSHYDDIINKIRGRGKGKVESLSEPLSESLPESLSFQKTWSLEDDIHNNVDATDTEEIKVSKFPFDLTDGDVQYIQDGQLERRWIFVSSALEKWTDMYLELFNKELLEDVPITLENGQVSIAQRSELNEVEFLIIEARKQMEVLLRHTILSTMDAVLRKIKNNVGKVLMHQTVQELEPYSDYKEGWLRDEAQRRFEHHENKKTVDRRRRIDSQANYVQKRVHGRGYRVDCEAAGILKAWDEYLDLEDHSTGSSTSSPESNHDLQVEFIEDVNKRLGSRKREFSSKIEELGKDHIKESLLGEFEKMIQRCRERANKFYKRLEKQSQEFKDAEDFLRLTDFSQVESKEAYWNHNAILKREHFLDKKQKYLKIGKATYQAFGNSLSNICTALKRSQEFAVIDFSEITDLDENGIREIAGVVREIGSVTGFVPGRAWNQYTTEIVNALEDNVRELLAIPRTAGVCFYEHVKVSEKYRSNHPYLLLYKAEKSKCTIKFRVQDRENHILTVRHSSFKGIIIMLNGITLSLDQTGPGIGTTDFQNDGISLPKDYLKIAPEWNELEIMLARGSGKNTTYRLSDVFLPAHKDHRGYD